MTRSVFGRLGCASDNQPYVVPTYFAYEPYQLYGFATVGRKIEWMRKNPKQAAQVATRWIPGLKQDVAEAAMEFNIQQNDRRLSANNYRALWSAQDRLSRVPGFVRGMVKRIYAEYARDRGIKEITPALMDTARTELGLENM